MRQETSNVQGATWMAASFVPDRLSALCTPLSALLGYPVELAISQSAI